MTTEVPDSSSLTEHPPRPRMELDTPFPYTDVIPSASAPRGTKESTLYFLLKATGCKNVEELAKHVEEVQGDAYTVWPYPCIRRFSFLLTNAADHFAYGQLLEMSKTPGAIYLELGCFFGTDSRKVIFDGWDPKHVVASDLRQEWFDLGYELFKDKDTCPIRFLAGDIFEASFLPPPPSPDTETPVPTSISDTPVQSLANLGPLIGRVNAMSAYSFFHLFEEEGQFELARRLARLISPVKGSIFLGGHQGGMNKGSVTRRSAKDPTRKTFVHSPDSWKELWETQIFPASRDPTQSGIKVKVEAHLDRRRSGKGDADDPNVSKTLLWSVTVI